MKYITISLIILLLVVSGCQTQTAPVEEQEEMNAIKTSEVIVVPKDVVDNKNPIVRRYSQVAVPVPKKAARAQGEGLVNVFGEDEKSELKARVLNLNDVACDLSDDTMTFTFRNPKDLTEGRVWLLDPPVPKSSPSNHVPVQIFFNGYVMNSPVYDYYRDGELMFGPNKKLSMNCEGKTQLKGGETATCSLTNVPLRSGNELNGYNRLYFNTPYNQILFQFFCD